MDTAQLIGTSAAILDSSQGYVTFFNTSGSGAFLASQSAGCWTTTELPGYVGTDPVVQLDATQRPWTAWFTGSPAGTGLSLRNPSGTILNVYRSTAPEAREGSSTPLMSTRGVNGTTTFPAFAENRQGDVHIYTRDGSETTWRDRTLSVGATTTEDNCPSMIGMGGRPCGACGTVTRCTQRTRNAIGLLGLTRTNSGRLFAAWTSRDETNEYNVRSMCSGPGSFCARDLVNSTSTGRITITRIDATATSTVLTLPFPLAAQPLNNEGLLSRGEQLSLVVRTRVGTTNELRYLEIDTTGL
jgi:hypothetical protein